MRDQRVAARDASERPALRVQDLGVAIDGRWVLLDLQLSLPRGEWVSIAGDNGAGKTTLFDVLRGRRPPDRGLVELHGAALSAVAPDALVRGIGWLGHQPGLYLDLSARENLVLAGQLGDVAHDAKAVEAALDAVGLATPDRARPVRTYSRGMAQRTALARLLLVRPLVWLLDEPGTGLDAASAGRLVRLLRAAVDAGHAVAVVSHDSWLQQAADRRVRLRDGVLAADGEGCGGGAGAPGVQAGP